MKNHIPLLLSLSIICAMATAMENDYQPLSQTTQPTSIQDKIKSLIRKKALYDAAYTGLVLSVNAMNICNVIWEEPTLHSDYFGANALAVGNKINTALALGLGLADIIWLIKPYCAFSHDTSQEQCWAECMRGTHFVSGHFRSWVASAVGICAGIRRYPQTLTMLTANALLDFAGFINADNHNSIAKEIDDIQDKSQ